MAVAAAVPDENRGAGLQGSLIRPLALVQFSLVDTVLPVHGVGAVVHRAAQLFESPRKKAAAVSDRVPDPFAPVLPSLGTAGIRCLFQFLLFCLRPGFPGRAPDVAPVLVQRLPELPDQCFRCNHSIPP